MNLSPDKTIVPCEEGITPDDLGRQVLSVMKEHLHGVDPNIAGILDMHSRKFDSAARALAVYFARVKAANPDQVMRAVQLTLNNYMESLGIRLVSYRVEPSSAARPNPEARMLLPDEAKSPTLGIIPHHMATGYPLKMVGFQPGDCGEEITVTGNGHLSARGYLPGEPMRNRTLIDPLRDGETLVVPPKGMLGVHVPVMDMDKLEESGLPHAEVPPGSYPTSMGGHINIHEMYFCRYLTHEAVARAMGIIEK